MVFLSFAVAPHLSKKPYEPLRCTGCGKFASRKTAQTWGGYMNYSPNGDEWVDFECCCAKCQGLKP